MTRIGVLTGGGDVPGLNAAIRAVTRRSLEYGFDVYGIRNGWAGLIDNLVEPLSLKSVSGILHVGGTMLGSSRTNPFKRAEDLEKALNTFRALPLDAIVAIGGEDTLGVAERLYRQHSIPVAGVPKTMDNDVWGTDYCIGFDTATTTVSDALDKLHTTASAHHRCLVVEVMGRHAGWVAVVGGLAGGADFIVIPEVPCTIARMCEHLRRRYAMGKRFSIIVIAEGAELGDLATSEELGEKDAFGHVRLDRRGLAETVAREVERQTGFETRSVVLGHLQRGGSPTVFDRLLATRLGVRAADMIKESKFGYMAALQGNQIVDVPLSEAMSKMKTVDPALYQLAEIFY
ncbi:MAG: ATP-dependent 6-phosphofructokinase [Anaerolineae bacterium]|nr:ATP-dependent 6-phosphofructokinase [Anaerolineae bacterium]